MGIHHSNLRDMKPRDPVSIVWDVIIREGYFDVNVLNTLSLVNVAFFNSSKSVKEENVVCNIPKNVTTVTTFSPRRVKVSTIAAIPPNAKQLTLLFEMNNPIPNIFPSTITHLSFPAQTINIDFETASFPPSLTHLSFEGSRFEKMIGMKHLPSTLRHLTLNDYFNQPLTDLPALISLSIGANFNQPLDNLPPSLTHLILHCRIFDYDLDKFPNSLSHLTVPQIFRRNIKFPPHMRYVKLGTPSQNLDDLPDSVLHLNLFEFEKPLGSLPSSLQSLTFGFKFNHPLPQLPSTLMHLNYGSDYHQYINLQELPPLTSIVFSPFFNQTVSNLPHSLTEITFKQHFNQSVDSLPPNLLSLYLSADFNQPVDHLPSSLSHLIIASNTFSHSLYSLPKFLITLHVGYHGNQPIHSLPASLRHLNLTRVDPTIVDVTLPPNLSSLFATAIPPSIQSFPASLQKLEFQHTVQQLPPLPESLKELRLPVDYDYPLQSPLPSTLKFIRAPQSYHFSIPRNIEVKRYGQRDGLCCVM